jgi:hypothetical protein
MSVPLVKYFKESSFGPITLYTGRRGSGLTLGAVIRLVRASKSKKPPNLVANCSLKHLSYKPMDRSFVSNLTTHLEGSNLFLFDSGYSYFASRVNLSRVYAQFFNSLRKRHSKAILTTSMGLDVIDRSIRDLVTDLVLVSSDLPRKGPLYLLHCRLSSRTVWSLNGETGKKERCMELYWKPISRCEVKRVGRYFKYYDTLETISRNLWT